MPLSNPPPATPHNPRLVVVDTVGDNQQNPPRACWSTLMRCAQDGDRDAYRTLLLQVEPYARSMARRCFRHPADVEDAVQDILMTIHAVRHTYDPGRPFAPWLVAIANRRMIDRLRHETRKRAREIELTADHETFLPDETNHDGMAERMLMEAIAKLPPDQRDAVQLLKLNEMSLKEASQMTGRSVGALKVATHRALANLRKLLGRGGAS
jgi:RNA polymerase sigma-70 factor (ECF subfamily)